MLGYISSSSYDIPFHLADIFLIVNDQYWVGKNTRLRSGLKAVSLYKADTKHLKFGTTSNLCSHKKTVF